MKKKEKQSGAVRQLVVLALVAGTIAITGGLAHATSGGTFTWQGNGFPNPTCDASAQSMLWIFNDNGSAVPTDLFINGFQQTNLQNGTTGWVQKGGGTYQFTTAVDANNFPPTLTGTYADYTGTLGSSTVLTLSGCNEGNNQPASITVLKTIPDVLEGIESVTVTFTAVLQGGDPTVPADVKGTCSITFTAGQTNGQCSILGLVPNTAYDVYETDTGGFAPQSPQTVTTGGPGSNTAAVTFENTFGPATAQACKVTHVDNTGHDASGDTFKFDLFDGSTLVATANVAGGGTTNDPVCESFNWTLVDNHTYSIVEESLTGTGWNQDSLVCDVNGVGPVSDFTPQFPGDADALFTCTATNSIKAAHATVAKVTIPAGSEAGFTFHLLAGGVDTGATATSTGTSALNFTPNVDLQDGVHYTVTEDARTGYQSDGGSGCSFTPSYPADSGKTFACVFTNTKLATATVRKVTIPAGSEAGWTFDLFKTGVVNPIATVTTTNANAVDFGVFLTAGSYTVVEHSQTNWSSNGGVGCSFTVAYPANAGQVFNCVFTNTHVSQGLTIGYWKSHLTFDSKHPTAPYTLKYLPKSLGNYVVSTTTQATAVFNANCSSTTSQNAVSCLAAQLLAAELNVANGADPCANAIIAKANSFLSGGTVDGVTGINYTGPTGNYSGITAAQRAEAISLKTALDTYNNGTCPV